MQKKEESLCFDDKHRKIDYVLVYKEEEDETVEERDQEKIDIRNMYHENLKEQGVELEIEPKEVNSFN